MGTLKVGIAGFGVVGRRRCSYIEKHPDLEVVSVCDISFRSEENRPVDTNYSIHTDYRELLKEDLDILFVCLTNDIAPDVTVAGLEKGLHVFCEKPPGRDLEDIAKVIRAERKTSGQKLMYGFNHRYHDSIRKAMEVIQSGEMGKIINMRGVYGKSKIVSYDSSWRSKRQYSGGGILLDQGIHMIDLMRMFAGEFQDIHSFVDNSHWNHDVEDNAYALMKTGEGIVAFIHSTATQWRHKFHLEIMLEKGSILLSGILSGSKSYGAETITLSYPDDEDGGDPKEVAIKYNKDNSWRDEINYFADCVVNEKPIKSGSSHEAYKTMELVYKIYCADESWKTKYNLTDTAEI